MSEQTLNPKEAEPARAAIERNIKSQDTWMRLLFMVLFVVLYAVSRIVVGAVVVLQFLIVLINGERNDNLLRLGGSLARYTYDIVRYLTFNTDDKPFPYAGWPSAEFVDED